MHTVLEILRRTTEFLAKKGVESPRLNAEHLLAHALGVERMGLYLQFERPLDEPTLEKLRPLVRRRGQREPLQHIVGTVDFGSLELATDRRALIPRPETEYLTALLVEQHATPPPASLLDLGTGSGAIALELARRFPEARVVAADRSTEALALARENAARNKLDTRVEWRAGDWFGPIRAEERFDWIVSNPPYLTEQEWADCAPEVREYDPKPALVAPEAGLADARTILRAALAHLAPGGLLALEVGLEHPARLATEARALGYATATAVADLTQRPRYLLARTTS